MNEGHITMLVHHLFLGREPGMGYYILGRVNIFIDPIIYICSRYDADGLSCDLGFPILGGHN